MPESQYEYVSNYDFPDDIPEHMADSGYEAPNNSGYLEPLRRNNGDLTGYIEPNTYYNSGMFWQKVLANAKQSEVQKFLRKRGLQTSTRNKKVNADIEGNLDMNSGSTDACLNEMNKYSTTTTCEDANDTYKSPCSIVETEC